MKYNLAIIGGGPGGYIAGLRAAQLGKKAVIIEQDAVGGICTNKGCIPTKYLLSQSKLYRTIHKGCHFTGPVQQIGYDWEAVLKEKHKIVVRLVRGIEFLLEKNGVQLLRGTAKLRPNRMINISGKDQNCTIEAEKIILAAGSRPLELPFLKRNGDEVITSSDALEIKTIPESLTIIGAGAIGLEMATLFQQMGSHVTVLELLPSILPESDKGMTARLGRILKHQGIQIHTNVAVTNADRNKGRMYLHGMNRKNAKPVSFESEKVLLALGRRPNSEFFRDIGKSILLDKKGFIKVNAHLETGWPGIYAIGDVIGGRLLAHKASHEGIVAAENASGMDSRMSYDALPSAIFTDPEFASVGLTQEEADERGMAVQSGVFSLHANSRALTLNSQEGTVKVIAAEQEGTVLGAHILAPYASELLYGMTLAVEKKLSIDSLESVIAVHPTLSESVSEACLKVNNRALHILNK